MGELLGLALIFISALSIGEWVLRAFEMQPLERAVLGASLGLGIQGLAVFLFGILHILYGPLLLAVFVLLPPTLAIWRLRRHGLRTWWQALREDFAGVLRETSRVEVAAVIAVLAVTTLLNLSEAITWDTCPDRYHVFIARSYLNQHGTFNEAGNLLMLYPELWESVYVLGLIFAPETPAALHVGAGALTFAVLFTLGRRLVSSRAGFFAALLYCGTSIVTRVAPMGYAELPLALFSLCAVYAASVLADGGKLRWAILAGVFTGFAAGCKTSALPYLLPPLVVLAAVPALFRLKPGRSVLGGLLVAVFCALTAFPWPLRAAIETGNPAYPFAIERFQTDEAYLCAADRFHRKFDVDARARFRRFGTEFDLAARSVIIEGCGSLILFPAALPLWFWMHRRRRSRWLVLLYPVWGFFLFVIQGPPLVRFFIPVVPGFVLVSGCGLGWVADSPRCRPGMRKTLILAAVAAVLAGFWFSAHRYRGRIAAFPPLTPGARGRQLERVIPEETGAISFFNGNRDRIGKVAFYGRSPRFRYFRVPFWVPSYFCPDAMGEIDREDADPREIMEVLRGAGVTHILAWKPFDARFRPFVLEEMSGDGTYLYLIQ